MSEAVATPVTVWRRYSHGQRLWQFQYPCGNAIVLVRVIVSQWMRAQRPWVSGCGLRGCESVNEGTDAVRQWVRAQRLWVSGWGLSGYESVSEGSEAVSQWVRAQRLWVSGWRLRGCESVDEGSEAVSQWVRAQRTIIVTVLLDWRAFPGGIRLLS